MAVAAINLACAYGQEQAKRALEITAAGDHNLLLTGLPGSSKTLMFSLSARNLYHRLPKVARTITDLAGASHIQPSYFTEALQCRARGQELDLNKIIDSRAKACVTH